MSPTPPRSASSPAVARTTHAPAPRPLRAAQAPLRAPGSTVRPRPDPSDESGEPVVELRPHRAGPRPTAPDVERGSAGSTAGRSADGSTVGRSADGSPAGEAGADGEQAPEGGEPHKPLAELGPLRVHRGEPAHDPYPARPRVVGPGRRERAYQARVARLGEALVEARLDRGEMSVRLAAHAAELHCARLVERGTRRYVDRLEERAREDRDALVAREQDLRRLAVAMGALQRENERLVGSLRAAEAAVRRLEAPAAKASGTGTGAARGERRGHRTLWSRLAGR